jgi:PHD-finger
MGHTMFIAQPGEEKIQDLPKWPVMPEVSITSVLCVHMLHLFLNTFCHKQYEGGCVKCGKGDNEEQILLCDKCDNPLHTYCALPPLKVY